MRVSDIAAVPSPLWADHVRLQATVLYDRGDPARELYWFDVPVTHKSDLTGSGDPWLACLVPLAMRLGEPLVIDRPVDPCLLRNVRQLMSVWSCWHDGLWPVGLEAAPTESVTREDRLSGRTATLFSGGADSLYTLLTHNGARASATATDPPIDETICVWGFDVPISNPSGFRRACQMLSPLSERLGARFVPMATNLKETRWEHSGWGGLSHGSALATMGLLLGPRYGTVLVPATYTYRCLVPWGSHPLTDPLHSTTHTRIVHDGAESTRAEKLERIAASAEALQVLRVCWDSGSWWNCGECLKCLRTMALLEVVGALDRCPTFGGREFDPDRFAEGGYADENARIHLEEIRSFALARGRPDVARAAERCRRRSEHIDRGLSLADWLNQRHLVWRISESLRRRLLPPKPTSRYRRAKGEAESVETRDSGGGVSTS